MRNSRGFQVIAAVLVYSQLVWPTLVAAQSSRSGKSVGIVTTLTGEATVLRADRPAQPLPLKFKDELYFKDRISTKQNSIARVLMGGRSLVTVREQSELTITEEPGRPSILDLFSGKIALAVAKLRMRPGETIEVRTPNAVAAVRGTVLVVEVTPASENGEAKPRKTAFTPGATPVQVPSFNTTFHVTEGRVDVFDLGGKLRQTIPGGQTLDIIGGAFRQPRPNPPNVFAGLKAGAQHTGTPEETKEGLANKQAGQALALAEFIAPPPPGTGNVVISTTGKDFSQPTPVTGEPIVTFTGFGSFPDRTITLNAPLGLVIFDPTPGASPIQPVPFSFPIPGVIDTPDLIIESNCGEGCGPPGQILQTTSEGEGTGRITTPYFATSTGVNSEGIFTGDIPVSLSGGIGITNSHVNANGQNVFVVNEAVANLTGSALRLTGTFLENANAVIQIGSTLNQTLGDPLLDMVNSHVEGNTIVRLGTGILTTAGGLIRAVGTPEGPPEGPPEEPPDSGGESIIASNNIIHVGSGGSLTVGGTAIAATDEFLSAGTHVFFVDSGGTAILNGPILNATDTSIESGNHTIRVKGTLTSNTTQPAVSLLRSVVTSDSGFLQVAGTATLNGSLLDATDSGIFLNNEGIRVSSGGQFQANSGSTLVNLNQTNLEYGTALLRNSGGQATIGGTLLSANGGSVFGENVVRLESGANATTGAVLILSGGAEGGFDGAVMDVSTGELTVNGTAVQVNGGSLTADALAYVGDSGSLTFNGTVLSVVNGTVTLAETIEIDGSSDRLTLNLGANQPVISLTNSTLTLTGEGANLVAFENFTGASRTQTGVALIANQSTINLENGSRLFRLLDSVFDSLHLTDTNYQIQLSNSVVNQTGSSPLIKVEGNGLVVASGGLLSATGSVINAGVGFSESTTINVETCCPVGLAITPNGRFAYVVNGGDVGDRTVSVIDTSSKVVIATVDLSSITNGFPVGVAIFPDGTRAYVAHGGDCNTCSTVSIINTADNTLVGTVTVGREPRGIAFSPNGALAYVTNKRDGTVSVINTATNGVIATVPVGGASFGVAVTPDGTRVYVTDRSAAGTVRVIDTATNTVIGSPIPVGSRPFGIVITPDGLRAYVPNTDSNNVSVINTANNTVTTIPVGSFPRGVAISPDGARVYVTNGGDNTVSIIDTAMNNVIATVNVGDTPNGVAVANNGTNQVFVANEFGSNVSVVDLTGSNTLLEIANNMTFKYEGTGPLLFFNSSTVTAGEGVHVGSEATLDLGNASLISASNSLFTIPGAVVRVDSLGRIVAGSTGTILSFTGGAHGLAFAEGAAIFMLSGGNSLLSVEAIPSRIVDDGDGGTLVKPAVNVSVGTVQPLRGGTFDASAPLQRTLLEGTDTDIVTNQLVKLDPALLDTVAPFLTLTASTLGSFNSLVDVGGQSQVRANLVSPTTGLANLNNSTLTVSNGPAFSVTGGSFFYLQTGSLFTANNTSLFDIRNGSLLTVGGNSVFRIDNGHLGTFGPTGTNLLNLANAPACSSGTCVSLLGRFNILLLNGATAANNLAINPAFVPFQDLGGSNAVTVANPSDEDSFALLVVDGSGSFLQLGPVVNFVPPLAGAPLVTLTNYTGANSLTLTAPLGRVNESGAFTPTPNAFIAPAPVPATPYSAANGGGSIALSGGIGLINTIIAAAGNDIFEVTVVSATIGGSALALTSSSSITSAHTVFGFGDGGSLTGTSSAPLLSVSSSSITNAGFFAFIPRGSTIALAGPFLSATGSTLSYTNNFIFLEGTLSSTTTQPLISLMNSPLTGTGFDFIEACCGTSPTLTLAGPLLSATNSTLSLNNRRLIRFDGGTVTSTTTDPFVSLTNSQLNNVSLLLHFRGGSTTTVNMAGPLLSLATTSTATFSDDMIFVRSGDSLTSTATTPFISVNNSTLNSFSLLENNGTVALAGRLFSASNNGHATADEFAVRVGGIGASLTSTSSAALFFLDASTLQVGHDGLLDLRNGGTVTLAGSSLEATNSIVNLMGGPVLSLSGGSTFTKNNTGTPAIKITGGSLTADLLTSTNGDGNHIIRSGGLLDLTNTSVTLRGIFERPVGATTDTVSITLGASDAEVRMVNSNLTLTGAGKQLVTLGGLNVPSTTSGGVALVAMNNSGTTRTLSLQGPLLTLVNGVTLTNSAPQIQLTNMTLTQGGTDSLVDVVSPSGGVSVTGSLLQATGTTFNLGGGSRTAPLLTVTNTTLTTASPLLDLTNSPMNLGSQPLLKLADGATITKTNTATPLIRINGGSLTADLLGLNANNDPVPTIRFDLSGTLLDLTDTTVQLRKLGEANPDNFGDDAIFRLGAANSHIPFIRMHNSTLTLTAEFESVASWGDNGPTPTTQNGVALISTATSPGGSIINSKGGLLEIGTSVGLTLTDNNAQVQLTNTTFTQTVTSPGGDSVISVHCFPCGPVVMTGPLLTSTGSTFTSLNGNFLKLDPGASLTRNSTSATALLEFNTSTVTLGSAFTHFVQINGNNGAGNTVTTLTLNGPAGLVTSAGSILNISGSAFLEVEDGGVLNGNTTAGGVININGGPSSVVTLGDGVRGLRLQGAGAMIDLPSAGALFDISNGATVTAGSGDLFIGVDSGGTFTSLGGDLIKVSGGGTLIANGTDAVVGIAGGTHSISTQVGAGAAMFNLAGVNTTLADPDLPGSPIGTDRPIRGPGVCPACANSKSLLFVTDATVNTNQVVKLDRALLEATFPLITVLNNGPGSTVFSISDAINLVSQAKLNAALASSIVSINAGTFTVGSGSLVNIAGGSVVNAANVVGFSGGGILNNLFGALVTLSGGSRFNLTNSFGIGSGTINLPTSLTALSGCGSCTLNTTLIPGFGVALGASVPSTVVAVNAFTPFQSGASATAGGIVLRVNDSASRVTLGIPPP